jgi:tyrosyl-tRNA synthetase
LNGTSLYSKALFFKILQPKITFLGKTRCKIKKIGFRSSTALVQGYDFYYLNKYKKCILQLGGSDQWGNIVTGTELIRRKSGGEAYAVTTPLIKKADGTKFGKTESGSVWLDPEKTSPYEFYQFWLNASDADAGNYIRIFTLKSREEIESLEAEHTKAPHLRILQKALAEDITERVHGQEVLKTAIVAFNILFGKSTADDLRSLSEKDFFSIFEGVPQATVSRIEFAESMSIVDALGSKTGFLSSNGEARRELKANAISVNKEKVGEDFVLTSDHLINNKYVLLGKGKKNNYILVIT